MQKQLPYKNIYLILLLFCFSSIYANIEIGTPQNLEDCLPTPTAGFDLTENDENVLNGLDPEDFSVYYFDNQADSNNNIISNAISNPANYTTGSFGLAQVWVNVVEDEDETNFATSTFLLNSNQQPIAINPGLTNLSGVNYFNVCNADDTFDLTSFNETIIGQQNGNFIISYFENQTDANNNQNSIADPENYLVQPDNESLQTFPIVARIEFNSSTDCFDTVSFDLNTYHKDENDVSISDLLLCSNSIGNVTFDLNDAFTQNNSELEIQFFTSPTILDDGGNNFISNTGTQGIVNTYNPILARFNYTVVMPSGFLSQNCPFEETFNVFPTQTPQIENIQDLIACSTGDEEITFDLTQNDSLALGDQTGNFSISYHLTLPEANEGINSVSDLGFDPTEFTLDNFQQFLFLRIENADEPECFSVDFFTLQDAGNLTAFEPENTHFCSLSGNDNLEIDLTNFDVEIKADQMNEDLIVEYFEDDVLVDNPSNYLLENETTTITAVLSLSNVDDCSDEVEFDITLKQTPEIQNLNDLEACSDFDSNATFNLTENTTVALGTQDSNEVEVAYFTSLQDAEENINSLESQGIDLFNYTASSLNETIFIRLQNTDSADCFVVDSFELSSFPVEINEVGDLVSCTEEGVNVAIFDLTEIESNLFPEDADASDYEIAYFDEADDEITNPTNYEITSDESILVEVTNLNNSDCVATTTFSVSFNVTPEIQNLIDLQVCSDFDFSTTFNLIQNIPEAIGTQDEAEIEIQFFSSLEDAENNENSLSSQEIDIENYPVAEEVETIFIRIQNIDSANCFVVDSFELQSYPVEINEVGDLVSCTEEGVSSAIFDLTEIESNLFPEDAEASDYEIAYFDEADDEITNPANYEITSDESILVEVTNLNNSDCVATTTFSVSFNVTPEIQNLIDLQVCSDFDFSTTFNLTQNISEAIDTQDEAEVEIQFFSSLEDAENNENSLSSQEIDIENYPVFEEVESIFIRLQNIDSSDCFVVDSFELQSFPVEVNEVDDIEECINSETQQASFDLEEIELTILGANQDSEFYSVVFFDENDELIESTNDFSITSSQTIIAEVFSLENSDCFAQSEVNLIALSPDNPECHLSVEDQVAFEFSTYPNPVVGQLSIDSNQPITQVEIFDIKGKQVYMQRGMDIQNLNFSNYPSGVYMLKMETESSSQIVKIVRE